MTPNLRDKVVPVRLSAAERHILGEKATVAGVSISSLIRQAALSMRLKPRPPKMDADAMRELAAIGNNLNQLARALNLSAASGGIDPVLCSNLRRQLDVIQNAMLNLTKEVTKS
jgi:hypothetical protein